jgi:hypothetical protein
MVDEDDPLYTGALWEFKNSDGGVNRATASLAHGWAASPTVKLTEQVLGVTPVEPGYATWSIKPHAGGLAWARGSVPTRYGDIAARWSSDVDSGSFNLQAETPAGTSGTIAVPAGAEAVVVVNGHVAWDRGKSLAYQATAVDGYVQLVVPGGGYHVTVNQ